MALFYKKAPYAPGLIRLGRIDGAIGTLSQQREGVVTIELIDE